jgi:hypothetical protein
MSLVCKGNGDGVFMNIRTNIRDTLFNVSNAEET